MSMDISANDLTKWAKNYLTKQGVTLNRVNNIPYGKRKGTIEKGWPDLQGFNSTGQYVGVEVKKIGDKLSDEQKKLLEKIWQCGGIVYICSEVDGNPTLIQWDEMKLSPSYGKAKK